MVATILDFDKGSRMVVELGDGKGSQWLVWEEKASDLLDILIGYDISDTFNIGNP
jgi:hypothetical protein